MLRVPFNLTHVGSWFVLCFFVGLWTQMYDFIFYLKIILSMSWMFFVLHIVSVIVTTALSRVGSFSGLSSNTTCSIKITSLNDQRNHEKYSSIRILSTCLILILPNHLRMKILLLWGYYMRHMFVILLRSSTSWCQTWNLELVQVPKC